MVLRVARRVLPDRNDAEDVFQATFIAFARAAGSIRRGASVSSWLHGVAHRLALKVRAAARRRQDGEARATAPVQTDPLEALTARELVSVVDEELQRLPENYRAPLLLCYWQGRTHDEAARQLGCPLGTLRSRLGRARELLRGRLVRRGVTPSAALFVAALAEGKAAETIPGALRAATVRAAELHASGSGVAGAVSGRAVDLALEVSQSMFLTRLKVAAALVLLALTVAGAGALLSLPATPPASASADGPAERPARVHGKHRNDLHGDPLPAGVLPRLGTVRLRHAGGVLWAVFCPDGKALLTGGEDGTVRQWRLTDGREVRRFGGPRFGAPGFVGRSAALSGDGKRLAAWEQEPSGVAILGVATGKVGVRIRVAAKGSSCLAWSPDNRVLAAGGEDGTLRLWDAKTGRGLRSVAAHKRRIDCVAFSPDGKTLATAGRDGALRLIAVAGKEEPRTLRGREKEFHFVAFSRDGKDLISAGDCYGDHITAKMASVNTIAVWDATGGRRRRDFRVGDDQKGGHEGAVSVALAPGGRALALGYYDHTIRLWDLASGKPLRKLTGFPDRYYPAYHVAFSRDGRTLAAVGRHHAVCLLDARTGKRLLDHGPAQECDIRSVSLSADGRLAATGGPDQTIVLWDPATGKPLRELRGHDGWVYSVALTADGRAVVSGGSDGAVLLHETSSGRRLRKMAVPFELPQPFRGGLSVRKVAVSPDGKVIASSHSQPGPPMVLNAPEGIRLWEASTGKELRALKGSPGDPCFLSFCADGKRLIAADGDRSAVILWDAATGKELTRCSPLGGARVYAIAVTADGRLAALSDWEGRVAVAEVGTGGTLLDIRGPAGRLCTLAFSANGQFLALACAGHGMRGKARGGDVELWELASGKRVWRHALPPDNGVGSAAFSADGRTLVTGMCDTTALVWDLATAVPKGAPRRAEDLWAALAGEDAAGAYQAQLALAGAPDQALPLFRRNVRPAAGVDRKRVLALVADLDSDRFAARERAAKALEGFGPEAGPVLEGVLAGRPSAEVRRRLKWWRGGAALPLRPGDELRRLRAIFVLEWIGTPVARRLLEALAKGDKAARQTTAAKAALRRLADRP
jgi:RNA polymerase sigma factor (sigma-70 family)